MYAYDSALTLAVWTNAWMEESEDILARPCSALWFHFSVDSTHAQSNGQAFGTYASSGGTKLTYRVKKEGTYGGYKIVTEVRACASQCCCQTFVWCLGVARGSLDTE